MGGRSFVANGARGAGSGTLSTIDEAVAESRWWARFRGGRGCGWRDFHSPVLLYRRTVE